MFNKKIVVHNLNKLRWLYSHQSFVSNILRPTTQDELGQLEKMLTTNQIPFTTKECEISNYHVYQCEKQGD